MKEYFFIENDLMLHVPAEADEALLADLWCGFTQASRKVQIVKDANSFTISTGKVLCESTDDCEYVLDVTPDGISISAKSFASVMRGYMTLLSKIEYIREGKRIGIKCGLLKDSPALAFRGVHLCIFPETRLEFLQKCIRTCGALKCSHIVLESWGMIKLDCMKELAWPQAFTKEQIRPLIKEANAMGIEVIPMFNHLGHAASCRVCYGKHVVLDQNPTLEYLFEPDGWCWAFEDDEVYALLGSIRKELMELCGESKYFHIGCDEAYACCQGEDMGLAMSKYLNKVEADLEADGRRAIMWGDMILPKKWFENETEHYEFNIEEEKISYDLLKNLSRNIIIGDWHYFATTRPWVSSSHFTEAGFDVMCCPWDSRPNLTAGISTAMSEGLLGLLHTTWHTLNTGFANMTLAVAAAWSGDIDMRNYEHGPNQFAAVVQRKVMYGTKKFDCEQTYTEAGWSSVQIGDVIL